MYKVDSSGLGILGRTIQISRIRVPFELGRSFGDQIQRTFLARIDYKVYRNSRINYRGMDQSSSDMFRKRNFGFYGRSVITDSPVGMIN